ncbi:neural cell adhesion molecule 1 isoform X1 [Drosophila subobscura]|uniref:neural cell adhesion molecule 1 isoform X1 n=1 Tax=Drosophila subobscura TaxID=7241 RepID=UPI00155A9455|nr:neural cell adhesion molecule 1 isoform X1 [Drosophila subobscura]
MATLTMWKIFMALLCGMALPLMPVTLARLHSTTGVGGGGMSSGVLGPGSGGGSNAGGSTGKDAHVKTKDVDAVEGKSVSLPCPITEPLENVYMVLWFRDNAGIPLYSFDVRDKEARDQPRHWSAPEVFGSRAKFHFDSQPATLEIKDIKRHDQGIYRCRVDFRTSQTQSFRFNLSVIILPEQPIILDRWGRQLNGSQLGPKQEGDDIVITCRVVGGRPQPQVRWLVNGLLVDNQNEHNSGDVIENRLLWPSVQRNDLNSVFTCQALNTQLDKPKEKSFILDMHLKPLVVRILEPPSSMIADRRYEVACESSGSRPNAIITWYKGKRQLRRTKDDISKNSTRSELSFVPTTDDDGKSITCRAENPNVNGLYLETMWKLNVVYPPLVTLRLGSTLTPDDIKEGDDVYFECHVQSNPQWRKLLWLHNGIHLEHNTSARVIRSNQSLVLQKITKHYAGNYACSAINDEGETVSNQLPLRVKYTPICKHSDRVILIGASKDETVEVICEIQADPPPRTFRWKFNNSGETLDVGSERFSVNGSRSILKYTPVTDQDYGTLSCWASNEVGTQQHPCLFQVVLAALPNAVSNCSIFNRTELSVDIQCIHGYDGGLPQIFVLEMFSTRTGITRFNLSNAEEALFSLENLDTLSSTMVQENNSLRLRIYSYNQKGRGAAYLLPDFIIGSTAYKTDDDVTLTLSPVIVGSVLTIIIIGVAIAIRIFVVTFVHNLRRNRHHGSKATATGVTAQPGDVFKGGNLEKPRWQHTDIKTKSSEDLVEDERDPDVIPSQYVGGSSAGSSGSNASNVGSTTAGTTTGSSTSTAVVATAAAAAATAAASASASDAHQFTSSTSLGGGGVSKWSPNSNVVPLTTATMPSGDPSNTTVTYNQINAQRAQLLAAVAAAGGGCSSTVISPSSSMMGSLGSKPPLGLGGTIIGSPTSLSSTATLAAHLQPVHSSGVGTLPPGLGCGGGYILNAYASGRLHHPLQQVGAGGGATHTATLSRQHQQQQHHNHHHQHQQQQQHPHHSGSSLLLGSAGSVMGVVGLANNTTSNTTTTTSCNSSQDLDDNININAIKDCLMTQRVPESCV